MFLEGPPQFGMTPDSVTIGYRKSVNSRVMGVQITDFGDFIRKIELDYDNEYYYFDTRLRTYWWYLLQYNGKYEIRYCMNSSKIPSKNHKQANSI